LQKNDHRILDLLRSENNELFLLYFKTNLRHLVESQLDTFRSPKTDALPQSYFVNHIAATFVETVRWWIQNKMEQSPEEITGYFLTVVRG
jgi:hypothetical protein